MNTNKQRIIYDNDACAYDFDEARRNLAESLDESPDEVSDSAVWDYIADDTRINYEAEEAEDYDKAYRRLHDYCRRHDLY